MCSVVCVVCGYGVYNRFSSDRLLTPYYRRLEKRANISHTREKENIETKRTRMLFSGRKLYFSYKNTDAYIFSSSKEINKISEHIHTHMSVRTMCVSERETGTDGKRARAEWKREKERKE